MLLASVRYRCIRWNMVHSLYFLLLLFCFFSLIPSVSHLLVQRLFLFITYGFIFSVFFPRFVSLGVLYRRNALYLPLYVLQYSATHDVQCLRRQLFDMIYGTTRQKLHNLTHPSPMTSIDQTAIVFSIIYPHHVLRVACCDIAHTPAVPASLSYYYLLNKNECSIMTAPQNFPDPRGGTNTSQRING